MKIGNIIICILLNICIAGCVSRVSSSPGDYIGVYVFRPATDSKGQFADILILRANELVTEVRFDKGADKVQIRESKWYLSYTTEQDIVIGDYSCPIHESAGVIKLIISDVGQYYEKVR